MRLHSFATLLGDTRGTDTSSISEQAQMTLDTLDPTTPGAAGQTQSEWVSRLAEIGRGHGFFERLGTHQLALFVQERDTLVVSFDRAARVFSEEADGLPTGFEAVQRKEWSLLSIQSVGDPWFRAPDLADFFDRLAADGFFDSFQKVIFLGLGPANGHAACAYSAAAPGASVLASAPAATLDPERAGFDQRFRKDRRADFGRYGDAPRLVAAARDVVILYDPVDPASAAHAAQFRADCVKLAPLRFVGPAPHRLIKAGGLLVPALRMLANGRLPRRRVAGMFRRVRRADGDYLWRLAGIAQQQGQFDRARRIADYATDVTGEARFAQLAETLAPGAAS